MTGLGVRGGLVCDGTGAPARPADLLIDGERLAAVEVGASAGAAETLPAEGCVVAPGFIDLHSHADFTLLAFPQAHSAAMQGITTVVVGNCGLGVAPIDPRHDFRRVALACDERWGVDPSWNSFGDYLAQLRNTSVNVAALVPHGAVRNAVMGFEKRPPSAAELARMRDAVAQAMDDGAHGLSSGLEYQPGCYATVDELATLATAVGSRGGVYASHIRNRAETFADAVDEALEIGRRSGARVQLSHIAPRPYAPAGEVERAFSAIAAAGPAVGVDTFPDIWGPGLLLDILPASVSQGTVQEVARRLGDAAVRRSIAEYQAAGENFLIRAAGVDRIFISSNPARPEQNGRSIVDLAAERGLSVADFCAETLIEAGPRMTSVAIRHIYATEEDLQAVMRLPNCSIESDGVVTDGEDGDCGYPWNAASYGYTARVLERYVRELRFYSIEEAVHRMASLPAAQAGISQRGTLRAGAYADVVVFDPAQVAAKTTDTDVARHPAGIRHVIVNGVPVVRDGRHTGARPGRLV